MGIEHCL